MKKLVNFLALAVTLSGAAVLSGPAPASATYYNPWTSGSGSGGESGGPTTEPAKEDYGIRYCCASTTSSCCHLNTGCAVREGACIQVGSSGG